MNQNARAKNFKQQGNKGDLQDNRQAVGRKDKA